MADQTTFTTDVGRLIMGSVHKGQTTDQTGQPLVVKRGPNAGQPRTDYFFAIAVPKKPGETHWSQTAWGKQVWETGHRAWPAGQGNSPAFAWKIDDGDSTIPNKAGRKLCDREGAKGCWVLYFGGGYSPKVCNKDGSAYLPDPDVIKLGYYVQVLGSCSGNGSTESPGVYLNHSIVSLQAYGPEISTGPDPKEAGFGQAPLPAGASATPIGAMAAAAPPAPYTPLPVTPNHAFAGGPAASPPPPPLPAAPPAPAHVMLPAAGGNSYEALVNLGWTDALLVQHGMMAP